VATQDNMLNLILGKVKSSCRDDLTLTNESMRMEIVSSWDEVQTDRTND